MLVSPRPSSLVPSSVLGSSLQPSIGTENKPVISTMYNDMLTKKFRQYNRYIGILGDIGPRPPV